MFMIIEDILWLDQVYLLLLNVMIIGSISYGFEFGWAGELLVALRKGRKLSRGLLYRYGIPAWVAVRRQRSAENGLGTLSSCAVIAWGVQS